MSPTELLLPFTLLLLLSAATAAKAATGFLLPIIKDTAKLQYYTTFNIGTPPSRIYFSVDIGNPTNWIVGTLTSYNQSSSYKSVTINTTDCLAFSGPEAAYDDCTQPPSPICNRLQCNGWASSPLRLDFTFSHNAYGLDPVVIDVAAPLYRRPNAASSTTLPTFPFVDTQITGPLKGLTQYSKGIVSLARNPMAIHTQISAAFKLPRKFAVCLPSISYTSPSIATVNGAVYFGGGPYVLPPSAADLSSSFATTPFVSNSHSVLNAYEPADPAVEYYIKINSIQIDGSPAKFNSTLLSIDQRGDGGTKLSTMVPYTKLHSEIYAAVVAAFVAKAKAMNIAVVGGVSSFTTCFNSSTIRYNAKTGSGLPVIELVMQGGGRWKIYGSNSMVKAASGVQCLAVFDAGPKPSAGVTPAIVIGGKQMEDNLVEFDLDAGKLGVSSTLLRLGTSCSQFKGI